MLSCFIANNNNNEKGSKERGVSGLPDENQSHKGEYFFGSLGCFVIHSA